MLSVRRTNVLRLLVQRCSGSDPAISRVLAIVNSDARLPSRLHATSTAPRAANATSVSQQRTQGTSSGRKDVLLDSPTQTQVIEEDDDRDDISDDSPTVDADGQPLSTAEQTAYAERIKTYRNFARVDRMDRPINETLRRRITTVLKTTNYSAEHDAESQRHQPAVWFLANKTATTYAIHRRIFTEIQRRAPYFAPSAVLEFPANMGVSFWASRDVWGDEVARYIGVENDQRAMRLARDLALDHGTPTQVHWLSTFNSERIGRNPLLVCAYTLSSRPPQTRMEIVDFLWSLCDGMLVLVENGDVEGFSIIREARQHILNKFAHSATNPNPDPNQLATIIAPCSHGSVCPLAGDKANRICHFSQSVPRSSLPARSRAGKVVVREPVGDKVMERFSYVVFQKGPRDRFLTPDRAMSASFYDAPHLVSTFALGRHADMSEVIDPSRHVASPEALSKAVVQPTAVHSLVSHGGSKGHAADNADMDSKRDADSQDKKGPMKHDSNKSDDKRSASGLRRSIQAQIASERARPPAPAPVFPIFSTNADEAVKPEHGAHHWPRLLMPILRAHRHVILDVCCPDGQARRTIVRRKGPFPGAYNASKKLSWGDLYPFPLELTTDEEAKLRAAMGDQYTTPDSEIVRRERRRLRALRQASERQHEQEATAILRQRSAELSPEEMLEEEMMNEHVVEEEVSDRFAKDERQMLRDQREKEKQTSRENARALRALQKGSVEAAQREMMAHAAATADAADNAKKQKPADGKSAASARYLNHLKTIPTDSAEYRVAVARGLVPKPAMDVQMDQSREFDSMSSLTGNTQEDEAVRLAMADTDEHFDSGRPMPAPGNQPKPPKLPSQYKLMRSMLDAQQQNKFGRDGVVGMEDVRSMVEMTLRGEDPHDVLSAPPAVEPKFALEAKLMQAQKDREKERKRSRKSPNADESRLRRLEADFAKLDRDQRSLTSVGARKANSIHQSKTAMLKSRQQFGDVTVEEDLDEGAAEQAAEDEAAEELSRQKQQRKRGQQPGRGKSAAAVDPDEPDPEDVLDLGKIVDDEKQRERVVAAALSLTRKKQAERFASIERSGAVSTLRLDSNGDAEDKLIAVESGINADDDDADADDTPVPTNLSPAAIARIQASRRKMFAEFRKEYLAARKQAGRPRTPETTPDLLGLKTSKVGQFEDAPEDAKAEEGDSFYEDEEPVDMMAEMKKLTPEKLEEMLDMADDSSPKARYNRARGVRSAALPSQGDDDSEPYFDEEAPK